MRIHILCGNAAYNKGDRGNLSAQIRLLKTGYPHAEIACDSYRSQVDQTWYDAEVFQRGFWLSWQQIMSLWKADVVIWGGGALIADNSCRTLIPLWLSIIVFVRFVLKKPIMAWAHGVVLDTKLGLFLAKQVYRCVQIITVRDSNSFEAIKNLGMKEIPVQITADTALIVQPSEPHVGKDVLKVQGLDLNHKSKPLIAIAPSFWPLYHSSKDILPFMVSSFLPSRKKRNRHQIQLFINSLTDLTNKIIERYNARVILLPRYQNRPWRDFEYLSAIKNRAKEPESVFVYNKDIYPPEDYLSIFYHFDFLVTTAFHDGIFATVLDIPCIQLFYEKKGEEFFKTLGAEERMLDWKCLFEVNGTEKVMDMIEYTFNNWDTIKNDIKSKKDHLIGLARSNLYYLDKIVGD